MQATTFRSSVLAFAPMHSSRSGFIPRNVGFTLIELLVVIAIILILARVLLPVLDRARNSADKVRCAGNLHQLGTAFYMYLNDWNFYPTPNIETGAQVLQLGGAMNVWVSNSPQDWARGPGAGLAGHPLGVNIDNATNFDKDTNACSPQNCALGKYANPTKRPCRSSVFWCPTDGVRASSKLNSWISYRMNGGLVSISDANTWTQLNRGAVAHPATTYLLLEEDVGGPNSANYDGALCADPNSDRGGNRHLGLSNALMCDGHVITALKGTTGQPGTLDYDLYYARGCFVDGRADATTN